ncbi:MULTISPECIES: haloacid dehalogenase type II [unclassified Tsukamurella]|uniref:haloacid dehalogenase type II n=1 Tax=unclassified Tsukamurella TaxID=2633480 RepID=UPI0031B9B789
MQYRAYLFDMQGTLFDFFTPVAAAVSTYFADRGLSVDSAEFTRAWRADYFRRVGAIPQSPTWTTVQSLYGAGFGDVCEQLHLPSPSPADAESVAESWQRLVPWPDVRPGLDGIRKDALTATLSNTDMSTIVTLCRDTDIRFDAYFTAELFGRFKPDPSVYLTALRYLGVEAHEAALVASHPYDLRAADELGLGTVYVNRPLEFGEGGSPDTPLDGEFGQTVDEVPAIR